VGIGEPRGGLKDSTTKKTVAVERSCSEFCIGLEEGVFEGDDAVESAAVESGGSSEYGVSETSLSFEYRTVEDNICLKFDLGTVGFRPGAGKNDVFLECTFVKDNRLRQC